MLQWSSVSVTSRAGGRESHESTFASAASSASGRGKTVGFVESRRKPRRTLQENPISSSPLAVSSQYR